MSVVRISMLISMLLIGGVTLVPAASAASSSMLEVSQRAALGALVVAGAPAALGTDSLAFSTDVDAQGNPLNSQSDFSSDTKRVWASFAFRDYRGESMSVLIRANGQDWGVGGLNCCPSPSGRYAFPIEQGGGNDLGGAAYDVFVYANSVEVAHGGFGVQGTHGFDHEDDDNDNDDEDDDDD
jgi:hypothetical protein